MINLCLRFISRFGRFKKDFTLPFTLSLSLSLSPLYPFNLSLSLPLFSLSFSLSYLMDVFVLVSFLNLQIGNIRKRENKTFFNCLIKNAEILRTIQYLCNNLCFVVILYELYNCNSCIGIFKFIATLNVAMT